MSYIGNLKGMNLCRIDNINYVMEPITEEQEKFIEENEFVHLDHGDHTKKVELRDIILYGDIDFNNEEDINIIANKNLVDKELLHSWIPKDFDYESGTGLIEKGIPKMYPTNDPIEWFKFVHCRLGKPKNIIVYKFKQRK